MWTLCEYVCVCVYVHTHTPKCASTKTTKLTKHPCTFRPAKFGTHFIVVIFLSLFFGKWLKSDIVWLEIAWVRVWCGVVWGVCLYIKCEHFVVHLYLWRNCIAFTRCIDTSIRSSGLLTYCKEWWAETAQCCHVLSCRGRQHVCLQCWYLSVWRLYSEGCGPKHNIDMCLITRSTI